jgi:serine/threonine protein kinase
MEAEVIPIEFRSDLKDFTAFRLLGRGSLGPVFSANSPGDGRVVLKYVPSFGTRHPRIPRSPFLGAPIGVETRGSVTRFVLPWVEGHTLRSLLGEVGTLTVGQTFRLAVAMASGLMTMHSEGLRHGDVKPENIIVSQADLGDSILIDFGSAEHVGRGVSLDNTTRFVSATLQYADPLLLSGHRSVSSDIYSLAMVLLEALTGEVPSQTKLSASTEDIPVTVIALLQKMIGPADERPSAETVLYESKLIASDVSIANFRLRASQYFPPKSASHTVQVVLEDARSDDTPESRVRNESRDYGLASRWAARVIQYILGIVVSVGASLSISPVRGRRIRDAFAGDGLRFLYVLLIVLVTAGIVPVMVRIYRAKLRKGLGGRALEAHAGLSRVYLSALESSSLNPDLKERVRWGGQLVSQAVELGRPELAIGAEVSGSSGEYSDVW